MGVDILDTHHHRERRAGLLAYRFAAVRSGDNHRSVPEAELLAVVADDAAMKITEVVRGEDLLVSTFRQLLLYDALGLQPPSFYHCPLIRDAHGVRLAKRHAALSLRELRKQGQIPGDLLRIP